MTNTKQTASQIAPAMSYLAERPTHTWIIGFKLNQGALDSLAEKLQGMIRGKWAGRYDEETGCSLIEYRGRQLGVERYCRVTAFVDGYKQAIFDFHKW